MEKIAPLIFPLIVYLNRNKLHSFWIKREYISDSQIIIIYYSSNTTALDLAIGTNGARNVPKH